MNEWHVRKLKNSLINLEIKKGFIDNKYNLIEIHTLLFNRFMIMLTLLPPILTPIAMKSVRITAILGKHGKNLTSPGLSMIH